MANWQGKGTVQWHHSENHAQREVGDALLQKPYILAFLNKKKAENTGLVPQYYMEDSHEYKIDRPNASFLGRFRTANCLWL